MILKSKTRGKFRIYLCHNKAQLQDEVMHKFKPAEKQYALDAFLQELEITHEFPLNGYATSSTPYEITKSVNVEQTGDDCIHLYHTRKSTTFPFIICNIYNNSTPIIMDNECKDNYLTNILFTTMHSLKKYKLSNIEGCIINKYDLLVYS